MKRVLWTGLAVVVSALVAGFLVVESPKGIRIGFEQAETACRADSLILRQWYAPKVQEMET